MGVEQIMKSAIEQLFYGTFADIEKIKLSEKQLKSLDDVIECEEKLTELLKDNAEAAALFEKFKRALDESTNEETLAFYKEGFRNGFQIALDGIDED